MSLKNALRFAVILTVCIVTSACASAEKSAGMVLDNASSALRSGEEKVWIDPAATPIATPR